MEMKAIENYCGVTADIQKCPRHADIESAWQVRPLTIKDSARRMLAISCAHLCGETDCNSVLRSHRTT
jgi:hypothetical protein